MEGGTMNVNFKKTIQVTQSKDSGLSSNPMNRLPLGDISVESGWLRGQLDLMCEGVTGRLPEFGPYFGKERNGFLSYVCATP